MITFTVKVAGSHLRLGKMIRIEVEQGSPLPVQLEKAGHRLRHAGMTTRIEAALPSIDVLELDLSGR